MSTSTTPPQRHRANVASKSENPPAMTQQEKDVHLSFMREALVMAEHALQTNETPVGCVFVHQGTVIGRGMNATNRSYNGTRHAEFMAISSVLSKPAFLDSSAAEDRREIGKEVGGSGEDEERRERKYRPEILKECDLYVTVEPCIMCASLLRQFGVRKVYFGASNEKFGGTGGVLSVHRSNGKAVDGGEVQREDGDYEVSGGWLKDEAVLMLQRFYMQENQRAPEPKARGKKRVVLAGAEVDDDGQNASNG